MFAHRHHPSSLRHCAVRWSTFFEVHNTNEFLPVPVRVRSTEEDAARLEQLSDMWFSLRLLLERARTSTCPRCCIAFLTRHPWLSRPVVWKQFQFQLRRMVDVHCPNALIGRPVNVAMTQRPSHTQLRSPPFTLQHSHEDSDGKSHFR